MDYVSEYLRVLELAAADKARAKKDVKEEFPPGKDRKIKKISVPRLEVFDDCNDMKAEDWLDTWQMHVIAKQYNTMEAMMLACTYLRGAPLRWVTDTKILETELFRKAFKRKYAPINVMKVETQLSTMRMLPGEKVRRYVA